MTSVLVVDDSGFMRTVVGNILAEQGYEVTTANNGRQAVEAVDEENPDVVTMDVEMPEMDGLEAVERIMRENPTRILMLSAHTETGADATLQALSHGAVDFVTKPGGDDETDVESLEPDLLETLEAVERADLATIAAQRASRRTAAGATETQRAIEQAKESAARATESVAKAHEAVQAATKPAPDSSAGGQATDAGGSLPEERVNPPKEPTANPPQVREVSETLPDGPFLDHPTVVIGASTGGPKTIERTLRQLPMSLDAKVLVVQHMPTSFTGRLAARLDTLCEYEVFEATDGARVRGGEVCIAKGGYHMEVVHASDSHHRIGLTEDEKLHGVRPAIDVTMCTAASNVAGPLVGVVLTGMGKDGARGISAIKEAGGSTIAQDEETSPVFGIPEQAIATGNVDTVLPADRIAAGILGALSKEGQNNG